MDENIALRSKRKTVSDHKAAIADMLTEMQRLNQQMQNDQSVIDRLNAETALLKEETRALLTRMGAPI